MTVHAPLLAVLLAAPPAPSAPLTLDDALAQAARANSDLLMARADRDVALGDRTVAWSNVLPRLDLTASFGRQFSGESSYVVAPGYSVPIPASSQASYSLGLRLEQPLFDGLRSWSLVSAGRARATAAEATADESSLAAAFEVTRLFLEVVRAERNLEVLQEAARRSQEVLRRAEALYQAGRVPKGDAIAARVNLGNDRISAELQRAVVTRARVSLCLALGRDPDPELAVVPPATLLGPGGPDGGEPPPAEALLETARRSRPLLRSQRHLLAGAEADVRAARGGYWPSLSAVLSYDRQGQILSGHDGVYGPLSRQYAAGAFLTATWNLFDGLRTTGTVDRAAAVAARTGIGAERAERQVGGEIAAARQQVITLRRSVSLAVDNLAAAETGLGLARDRLDKGAATQLEVRDAELKMTQARLALIGARIDEAIARADLNRAVGGAL